MTTTLRPGRLRPRDVLRVGGHGLRARPVRVVLSALGIAIGIAAMVAVVGISTSSRAELNRLLDALGTNLLTAAPGTTLFGEQATLPDDAVAMVGRTRSRPPSPGGSPRWRRAPTCPRWSARP